MPRTQEGLARLVAREGVAEAIVQAYRDVDRQGFVPHVQRAVAYQDRPVALPKAQTTSQPSLIARMIDAVAPKPTDTALEVGTGFGFQTALLARLVDRVFSIERHEELARAARDNLERAGIAGVEVVVGDGWEGIPDQAPFDVIIVSAAASDLPRDLADQLAEGGRMVIPITASFGDAVMTFVKRAGSVERGRLVTPARFVPLVKGSG